MPLYLFSINDKPPPPEFAIDLPDRTAAIREALLVQAELWRHSQQLCVVTVWDENRRPLNK